MSPDDIAQRLGDRFRLLAGGRRTARAAPADAPRADRLELGPADRRRPAAAAPAVDLRRRLDGRAAARIVGDDTGTVDEVELLDGLTRLVDRAS